MDKKPDSTNMVLYFCGLTVWTVRHLRNTVCLLLLYYPYSFRTTQHLAQAAQEINALIEHLQGDYDTTPIGNMQLGTEIVNRISQNPTLQNRVVNAIKASSVEAVKQAISSPVAAIIIAGVQDFIEA